MGTVRPLVFVAMPFGTRKDVSSGIEINFDQIYEKAIRPAAEALDLEVIRGDEEHTGGIIMRSVFERLLLSEIVIADLTMQNPNVFYEVGVRHCARPRSTILMYAHSARLPFDVAMIRAVPYELEDGILTEASAASLEKTLSDQLLIAVENLEIIDSPLSQLIPTFPYISLSHDDTESFRERVVSCTAIKTEIFRASAGANADSTKKILQNIESTLGKFGEANAELFVDLLFAYRDVESWDDMLRICDLFSPETLKQIPKIIEQRAFALNRRNSDGDRDLAIRDLEVIVTKYGDQSETCGLIGRIYKNRYQEEAGIDLDSVEHEAALVNLRREGTLARGYLGKAIEWYERGFSADPRDYYPGINEATLRYIRSDEEDVEKLADLLPAVSFSVARVGSINSSNYWAVATVLELNVLREHWESIERTLEKLLVLDARDWMYKTTADNLNLIKEVRRMRNVDISEIEPIIFRLRPA